MSEQNIKNPDVPTIVYGLFAGAIDQLAVQRFHNVFSLASHNGVKHIHIIFQTNGGIIGDGISLYNLFRASPVDMTLYNVGTVCSIGVIAFLGAKNRKTSKYATFMIHRSYMSPAGANSERLASAASQMILDDARVEGILKSHTKIPAEKWDAHKFADVWLSAKEAVECSIADGEAEFSPPLGSTLFNVWPPQT